MRNHLIGFLAGLAVAGAVGCEPLRIDAAEVDEAKGYKVMDNGGNFARLDKRLTDRLNASELHIVQRLERIEANQTALMLRFGFRPEGGK